MKKEIGLAIAISFVLLTGHLFKSDSCKQPYFRHKQRCREIERVILASTVRLLLHGWVEVETGYEVERINGTISHATIVGGRYLFTHNHFGIPLSQALLYDRYANGGFTGVSVYRLDGVVVLDHVPLDSFVIIEERGETAVLDFGTVDGEGLFASLGLDSAPMAGEAVTRLRPGMEVAQIDWDGLGHTEVIWTRIDSISLDRGIPSMQVSHFIELGASGGGVFVNGVYVGNNWGRITEINPDTGKTSQHLTLVALNQGSLGVLQPSSKGL